MRKLIIAFAITSFTVAGAAAWALHEHSLGDLAADFALVVEHGSATQGQLGSGGFTGGANGGGANRGGPAQEAAPSPALLSREAGTIR